MTFNWHSDTLTATTAIDGTYKNTQNVRRFMHEHCGAAFKFDRDFMAWILSGNPATLGDVVDEYRRRQTAER